ncbi:hypothetical protein MMC34_006747 [Xylographa carneopallida]|nr:hypothetical protein [Xylographa carneopallida]
MAIVEDLIDFDIIETQKENIQSLPQGRSAKALASTFAPALLFPLTSTPGVTRNLNDAIRQEYELELIAIADSDDPLDIYDRYVKWTLNAYPSAQATPESQLRPLLERVTKSFQTVAHYKNDPRYLKLWLSYIRFFSDAPKETFAYLARHNIGEGLALFYEEFAAWLEGAGRWTQAEEVFKLGIEREARPAERLLRKFGEFKQRTEQGPRDTDEPSSPALPNVRPALVAKIDPFALSTPRPSDPQAQRLPSTIGGNSTSRGGRQKLAIFSDTDVPASNTKATFGDTSKGWDNIGSIQERKKENTVQARPWAGETLRAGKKIGGPPKMMIFKDETTKPASEPKSQTVSVYAGQQMAVNPRTGKVERVFVNLEAVYPNPNDSNEEYSFEELRAKHRGWLDRSWPRKIVHERPEGLNEQCEESFGNVTLAKGIEAEEDAILAMNVQEQLNIVDEGTDQGPSEMIAGDDDRSTRPRKKKIMEVRAEAQTIKTNLESPTGPKLRRKNSAEPTMTLHTRAATDDILDIFNQPLRNIGLNSRADSADGSDYDDDDYTSAGESTGTGRMSGTSEYGDDETGVPRVIEPDTSTSRSADAWSEFTASKHVPNHAAQGTEGITNYVDEDAVVQVAAGDVAEELLTPISPSPNVETTHTKYIPLPPEDYEPPTHSYRDPIQILQNRLPFMTPIVEKTESSIGLPTARTEKDYFSSKTPSRRKGDQKPIIPEVDDILSSPFQEIVDEVKVDRPKKNLTKSRSSTKISAATTKLMKESIIRDAQCNPVDDSIRNSILENIQPPLSSLPGFYDHRPQTCAKGPELRKFVKALAKLSKNAADKTISNLSMPPTLSFPSNPPTSYTVIRELGKGAFAPVYLASPTSDPSTQIAIKAEHPPTPWEFYIMTTAHTRLAAHRAADSVLRPHALHLFADEGYLLEAYHPQGTLLDAVNACATPNTPVPSLDEPLALFFALELLRTLDALHAHGLMHGDLKPDNCLVRLPPLPDADWAPAYSPSGAHGWAAKGVTLIDFGRGIDLRAFGPAVAFVADWKTDRHDCPEMRAARPWSFHADYWGLAGVVHVLLFGRWLDDVLVAPLLPGGHASSSSSSSSAAAAAVAAGEDGSAVDNRLIGPAALPRHRLREPLKRYWATELWAQFFDMLLNPGLFVREEEGGRLPIRGRIAEVKGEMERWLVKHGERRGLKAGLRRLEERVKGGRR